MKNFRFLAQVTCAIFSFQIFSSSFALAADSADSVLRGSDIPALRNLDYPELQVVPRATDRLFQEATVEKASGYWSNWTIEASALTTLIAGYMHNGKYKSDVKTDDAKKESDYAALSAMAIGSFWLGMSYYFYQAEPYNSSATQIRNIKVTDKKSELLRERMAEEALEKPARNMNTVTNLAVFSNLIGSAYVLSYANSDNRIYGGISALASLLPLIFSNRYVENYNKHLEYKKRIFTPLSMTTLAPVQLADKSWDLQPQVLLTWKF